MSTLNTCFRDWLWLRILEIAICLSSHDHRRGVTHANQSNHSVVCARGCCYVIHFFLRTMAANEAPVISIVAVSDAQSNASPLAASASLVGNGSLSANPRGAAGGRRRSNAVRAATKEDADREPLLVKATREEHMVALRAPGLVMALSSMQGWRKTHEDAHVVAAVDSMQTCDEIRAPGRPSSPPPSASPSASPSAAPSVSSSPLGSNCPSPDAKGASPRSMLEAQMKDTPVVGFMGIFDGHNGRQAADFAASHMLALVSSALAQLRLAKPDATTEDEAAAIQSAFQACDDEMRSLGAVETGGCTAACAIITDRVIHLASAGDCKLAAVDQSGAIVAELTRDHAPAKNAAECDRVAALGYSLHDGRLMGKLAVTRALGDFEFKPAHEPPARHPVLAVPDVVSAPRAITHAVVLGCDGVWELNEIPDVAKSVAAAEFLSDEVSRVAHASCATNRPFNPNTKALAPGNDNVTFGAIVFE